MHYGLRDPMKREKQENKVILTSHDRFTLS
jgi:hypothetical protein